MAKGKAFEFAPVNNRRAYSQVNRSGFGGAGYVEGLGVKLSESPSDAETRRVRREYATGHRVA